MDSYGLRYDRTLVQVSYVEGKFLKHFSYHLLVHWSPASRPAFLSYRKLRFYTIKNAPRGCALGARVDGCRSNRASARECAKAHSFFSSYRKLRFYTIKNAPRGSHFGGMELCRLRDPPQAENPAKQDSIFTAFHKMQHTSSPILPYPKRKRMRMP